MDRIITSSDLLQLSDLTEGAILLVDKPLTWTSFDVVNKIRWSCKNLLSKKKYKVGHAGTLDPLATGLLLICIGPYTKKAEEYQSKSKKYEAEVKLFETTETYDAEVPPDCYYPIRDISGEEITEAFEKWIGEIMQLPPIYSAIKQKGVALYKLARRGKSVEVKPRRVVIHSIELLDYNSPYIKADVACSKGTYIRSLAHDIGKTLDTGAHLSALRRTAIGDYHVNDAWELPKLVEHISSLSNNG